MGALHLTSKIWLDGMMGLIAGDALGVPVQFMFRDQLQHRDKGPVTGMEGGGVYAMPAGTWSDDGSMALATLDSIVTKRCIDLDDIMERFMAWNWDGAYTQYGSAFDQGNTCTAAIYNYSRHKDVTICGETTERSNGNGSLMRILPACLYVAAQEDLSDAQRVKLVEQVSGLTHNHVRSRMGCGIYFFMVQAILHRRPEQTLPELLKQGADAAWKHYSADLLNYTQLLLYNRVHETEKLAKEDEKTIKTSGYVVDTLEAAVWALATTDSLAECLLKIVNLGDDTDTVAAVAGGLAGLYYGMEGIPKEWLDAIVKKNMVEDLCEQAGVSL